MALPSRGFANSESRSRDGDNATMMKGKTPAMASVGEVADEEGRGQTPPSRGKRVLRSLAALLILGSGIAILSLDMSTTGNAARKDFISYWAAGRLLLSHQNPYDSQSVFRLEKSVGFEEPEPLIMRNPPYALFLAIPLGFFEPRTAVVLWSILIVFCIVISVRLLWTMHGRPTDPVHLFAYLFAPTVACMVLGQTSPFVLFGVVGFLYWHRTRPFAAGLSIVLMAIKPQILLPFGLALLCWIVVSKAYRMVVGTLVGLAVAMLIPSWLCQSLWSDYLPALARANAETALIPTVSSLLRAAISPRAQWLQFLPVTLGCCWSMWYFTRHKTTWDWNRQGSLLLLVSLWTAPYAWFSDEVVVLPAVMEANYWRARRDKSLTGFLVLNGLALLLVLFGAQMYSGAFLWTSTAWLGWFLFAFRSTYRWQLLRTDSVVGPSS